MLEDGILVIKNILNGSWPVLTTDNIVWEKDYKSTLNRSGSILLARDQAKFPYGTIVSIALLDMESKKMVEKYSYYNDTVNEVYSVTKREDTNGFWYTTFFKEGNFFKKERMTDTKIAIMSRQSFVINKTSNGIEMRGEIDYLNVLKLLQQ